LVEGKMMDSSPERASTQVSRVVKARREAAYNAFLDPACVAAWLPPNNMKGHVHFFNGHEGGTFRISLIYQSPEHPVGGKSSAHTDTFHGRFVELVPFAKIVEVVEFESHDPAFAGAMKITVRFTEVDGGTEITFLCQDIPTGIRPEDNEQGCKESLAKLAALIEE
jgi:uncharacterized protein YndB with AHSA1/START domain